MGTLENSLNPDAISAFSCISKGSTLFAKTIKIFRDKNTSLLNMKLPRTCDPMIYTMNNPKFSVSNQVLEPINIHEQKD